MPYSQVNALDYADIKTALREYLRQTTDFTDYDFEASSLSAILDLLAYNTYYNSFNVNMAVNEAFIDSASLRDNVVKLAKQLGYTPKSRTSARAVVSLTVDVSTANPVVTFVTLKKGNVFIASNEYNRAETYQFSTLNDVVAPVVNGIATFSNLPTGYLEIVEGTDTLYKFTVDNTIINQKFIIPTANIDTSTINVNVRDNISSSKITKFNQVDNFLITKNTDPAFYVEETNDSRFQLIFGDDVVAKKLSNGNIVEVSYLVSNGKNGNSIKLFTFSGELFDQYGSRLQNRITTATINASGGGDDVETVESIRLRAPAFYSSQDRAVTKEDYKIITQKIYPSITDIIVYGGEEESPPQYGRVKIAIKPKYTDILSNSSKLYIKSELKKYCVASLIPEILDPSIIDIILESKIFYNPIATSLSSEQIRNLVITNLTAYKENSNVSKFGGVFRKSKMSTAIDASDASISSNQTNLYLRKKIIAVVDTTSQYLICFNNALQPGCSESILLSTSFKIAEFPTSVAYFENIPDGTIRIYTIDPLTNKKIILKDKAGTINFSTGQITLNSINFISGSNSNNEVYLTVPPLLPDIYAVRETYLNLAIDSSTFQIIQDSN
jgi:hypothetical protein